MNPRTTKRNLSIAEIARQAGVSSMTVSRVVNGKPGVGDETRERILKLLAESSWVPSPTARALRMGTSHSIGIVALESDFQGVPLALYGIERAARAAGFGASIVTVDTPDAQSIREAVKQLERVPVGSIIVMAPQLDATDALNELAEQRPLVAIWAPTGFRVPVATVDHESGAAAATRHLIELGHHTVHHVSGPVTWNGTHDRIRGWERVLNGAGREIPGVRVGDWGAPSGYEVGLKLLRDPAVTAVFAASDHMALGLLRASREVGRRVPEDLSIVGYDGTNESEFFSPPLTTVAVDFRELGGQACAIALSLLDHESTHAHKVVVPAKLVVRESTAPPPGASAAKTGEASTPTTEP